MERRCRVPRSNNNNRKGRRGAALVERSRGCWSLDADKTQPPISDQGSSVRLLLKTWLWRRCLCGSEISFTIEMESVTYFWSAEKRSEVAARKGRGKGGE